MTEDSLQFGYTTVEAAALTGMTRGRIQYLAEKRLVTPVARPGGRRRYYSFQNLVELRAISHLIEGDDHASIAKVRKVVDALRQITDRPLLTCTLLVKDGEVLWADLSQDGETALIDILRGFQTVLVAVNLATVEAEVRRAAGIAGVAVPQPIAA